MRHVLTINGTALSDFNAYYDGSNWFAIPEKDIEKIEVAGRNGDLTISNGRFKNISIEFPCYIRENFRGNYSALINFFYSLDGYLRVESDEDPSVYRMGLLASQIDPEMLQFNRAGMFSMVFDFMPQKWLKSGENRIALSASNTIYNPSQFDSKPIYEVQGTGSITVNGVEFSLSTNTGTTVIDCDLQDAYEGTINRNRQLTITGQILPVLKPGANEVTVTGFTSVNLIPKWWRL